MALKFSFRFNKPIFFIWKAILVEENWMCTEADCGNGNFLVGTTYKPQTQFWYLKTHTHDVHLTAFNLDKPFCVLWPENLNGWSPMRNEHLPAAIHRCQPRPVMPSRYRCQTREPRFQSLSGDQVEVVVVAAAAVVVEAAVEVWASRMEREKVLPLTSCCCC